MAKRLYLDTNIFIHCGLSYRRDFAKQSKKLLEQVANGKYEGVVSLLCLTEICEAIRGTAVEALDIHSPDDWDRMIGKAISFIFQTKNVKIIENDPNERIGMSRIKDLLYCSIAEEANRLIRKYRGKSRKINDKFKHKGVGCVDCLHIALAKRAECDMIATFDKGFKDTESEIEPFIIQERIW